MTAVRPIFIIGAPRSGTSALTWALGQHPNIQPMPETGWIAGLAIGGFLSFRTGSQRGRFSHLSNVGYELAPFLARLGEAAHGIVNECFEERCRQYDDGSGRQVRGPATHQLRRSPDDPKQRWIDGTPLNTSYAWPLAQMFPGAVFLHSLRRPDDVVTSLEGFAAVGGPPFDLQEGLRTWMSHTEAAVHAERAFGSERVFRVEFQRIIDDPAGLVRDICSFIGEPDASACAEPLRERVNSSNVDHLRADTSKRLRALPGYAEAEALYRQLLATPVPVEGDFDAELAMRRRFLEVCANRFLP